MNNTPFQLFTDTLQNLYLNFIQPIQFTCAVKLNLIEFSSLAPSPMSFSLSPLEKFPKSPRKSHSETSVPRHLYHVFNMLDLTIMVFRSARHVSLSRAEQNRFSPFTSSTLSLLFPGVPQFDRSCKGGIIRKTLVWWRQRQWWVIETTNYFCKAGSSQSRRNRRRWVERRVWEFCNVTNENKPSWLNETNLKTPNERARGRIKHTMSYQQGEWESVDFSGIGGEENWCITLIELDLSLGEGWEVRCFKRYTRKWLSFTLCETSR